MAERRTSETGCQDIQHSLVSAIRDKYDDTTTTNDDSFCQIFVPKSGPGAQGSGEFVVPTRLAVDNCDITVAGSGEDIQSLCSKVQELDLAKNRITDWLQVFHLLQFIPSLQLLNLSFNQLDSSTFPTVCDQVYTNISVLILNGTGVSWDTVTRIINCFPSLSELHLSLNKYEEVDLPDSSCHRSVTKLFVNECKLHNWKDIDKLGKSFPCLESLNVIKSALTTIEEDRIKECFPALKALNISGNPVESWEEIDKLRLFPALESLRIFEVPLFEEFPEKERRQHLISRLPNLLRINGSKVTATETEDAERAFIRYYMNLESKPQRFHELEAQYGKLAPLVHVDFTPMNIKQIKVKFEDKEEIMDVDLRQTIFEFKKLLQNFTGLPPTKFRLFHIENYEGAYKDTRELKMPNKILRTLNFKDDSEIQIDRKFGVKFEDKEENMDVDLRQTIFEFKKLLQNFTGLPSPKFRLIHIENCGRYKHIVELNVPNKVLRTINFKEDSEIEIVRKFGV